MQICEDFLGRRISWSSTREEALDYCFEQITPSVLTDVNEYNKFKTYRQRIKTGKAGKNAVQTLFDRFGVVENC